jgi:hypothetical protein
MHLHLRLKVDGKWTWEAVGIDPHTAVTLRSERSIPQAEPIRIKSLHRSLPSRISRLRYPLESAGMTGSR